MYQVMDYGVASEQRQRVERIAQKLVLVKRNRRGITRREPGRGVGIPVAAGPDGEIRGQKNERLEPRAPMAMATAPGLRRTTRPISRGISQDAYTHPMPR